MDVLKVFIQFPLPSDVDSNREELGDWSSLFHICVIASLKELDRLVKLGLNRCELLI